MSNSNFKLYNISTLAGSSWNGFRKVLKGRKIDRKYYTNVFFTAIIILIASPFRWWEYWKYRKLKADSKPPQSPLFILGHWRSGTTFLHNVLCQDPKAAYITTYQSLFPEHLASKWLFKSFMSWVMPEKRPSDNVKLSVDYPQEDEFALGNLIPYCYYHFFHFPSAYAELYEKFVEFQISDALKKKWKGAYHRLILKAVLNTQGERAIFKNPVNTARVKILLEMYPKANFIYIYRNPIIVYLSTKKFFIELFPTLQFEEVEESDIIDLILDVYERLFKAYQKDKSLIPPGQLKEIRFDDFEKRPLEALAEIYQDLSLDEYESAKAYFQDYLESLGTYRKNKYSIKRSELEQVQKRWGMALDEWSYDIPENLVIED